MVMSRGGWLRRNALPLPAFSRTALIIVHLVLYYTSDKSNTINLYYLLPLSYPYYGKESRIDAAVD